MSPVTPDPIGSQRGGSRLELDPQIARAIASEPSGQVVAETLSMMRAASNKPSAPPSPGIERQDYTVEGDPTVVIRVHRPTDAEGPLPVVYSMHGGGYVLGSYAIDDARLDGWAKSYDCIGVSVDYRLAPETRYSGSLEDNYAALKWVYAHAEELGIDRSKIAVGGESAGGGHAASLAIHARDRNEVPIVFQLLIYPALDDRTGSTRPVPPAIGHFMWTASANRFAWSSLLGVPAGSSKVPVAAVPARVASVAGLPPAWIGVGSIDLFVEEDMEYARQLVHAGVATELLVVSGAFHGFDLLVPDAEVSQQFSASWKSALRKAFATSS